MVPVLSRDLLEMIIDELGQDRYRDSGPRLHMLHAEAKAALQACAIASSILRARAQYQLFLVIHVGTLERIAKMRYIATNNLSIAENVRHLMTSLASNLNGWTDESEELGHPLFEMASLLRLLTNMKQLTLHNVDFALYKAPALEQLYAAIPNTVTQLKCKECTFADNGQLIALLHAFRSPLRYLWIEACHVDDENSDIPASIFSSIEPETLIIHSSVVSLRWLDVISPRSLTYVEISIPSATQSERWQVMLNHAHQLQTLRIDGPPMSFDLSALAQLRSVSVRVYSFWSPHARRGRLDFSQTSFDTFLRLLGSATRTSTLDSATLVMETSLSSLVKLLRQLGPEAIDWPKVQRVVDSLRWANDRKNLRIVLRDGEAKSQNLNWHVGQLEAALAHYQTRGITIDTDAGKRWYGR